TADVERAVNAGPARLYVLAEVGDQRRIGQRSFAEPDEDEPVHFADREAPGAEVAADRGVTRDLGAGAIGGGADAVIAAPDVVADDVAGGKRRLAVRTAVGQHRDVSALAAEDHQRLVADRPRQRLFPELGRGRRRVPLIAKERSHWVSSRLL